jgi:hypothetical protein
MLAFAATTMGLARDLDLLHGDRLDMSLILVDIELEIARALGAEAIVDDDDGFEVEGRRPQS